jgi:hypothetical protein
MYWVGTYLGDLFANRLDLIESLAEDGDHLVVDNDGNKIGECTLLENIPEPEPEAEEEERPTPEGWNLPRRSVCKQA